MTRNVYAISRKNKTIYVFRNGKESILLVCEYRGVLGEIENKNIDNLLYSLDLERISYREVNYFENKLFKTTFIY